MIYRPNGSARLEVTRTAGDTLPLVRLVENDGAGDFIIGLSEGSTTFEVQATGNVVAGTWQGTAIGTQYGGTGSTTYTDGQVLIGCTSSGSLVPATLTPGTGITIGTGCSSITINATGTLQFVTAPLTSGSTGTEGQVAIGNVAGTEYLYVCYGLNQWGRIAMTTVF